MITKRIKAMEILWMLIAIITLSMGAKVSYFEGFRKSYPLFICSAVAVGMFFFRKNYGNKLKKESEDK